jgi:hypothetical protein
MEFACLPACLLACLFLKNFNSLQIRHALLLGQGTVVTKGISTPSKKKIGGGNPTTL